MHVASGYFILLEIICFRRTSVEHLSNPCSESQIFDNCMCVMYVMMSVVCVGRTGRLVTVKIIFFVDSIHASSSSSRLSCVLGIPNLDCSLATSG